MMDWISSWGQILTTVVALATILGYLKFSISKDVRDLSKDMARFKEDVKKNFDQIHYDLKQLQETAQCTRDRISKLEGKFEERNIWEAKLELNKKPKGR